MLAIALLPLMSTHLSPPESIYGFNVKTIDGAEAPLKKYRKNVILVVNVASKCGNTPQYAGLEKLYQNYRKQGFTVLGFPANEFGGQEPGTNADIKEFCTRNYGVTFPMHEKIVVKGPDTHPLYAWLVASSDRPKDEVEWNFAKFLVGRDGKVIKRFSPKTLPDNSDMVAAIEAALKAPR